MIIKKNLAINKDLLHNRPWKTGFRENQALTFDLNKGPTRDKYRLIGQWSFEIGISIFGPKVATLTLKYRDPIYENIQCLRESQWHKEALKATSNDLDKGSIFQTTIFQNYYKDMSKDGHTLGWGELLADFCTQRSLFCQSQ